MTTGGTESFTYDTRGLKQTYRNPGNVSGNPTARYQYDTLDRVKDVTDALGTSPGDPNHTTSFTYNLRGQVTVTTLPKDPVDNQRHTIINAYNSDGTLQNRTNQRGQVTRYTYDDYRRVKSMTPPVRGFGDTAPHTTEFSYYVNGMWDDYRYTDSNVAWIHLPSGKWINTVYDDNRRKTGVTVGWGTADAATTTYEYDNVGNVKKVTNARGHWISTAYDERNRPSSVNDRGDVTTFKYDLAGRKKSVTRPNNQVITYVEYDAMNRLKQQDVTQNPGPLATTKYTYTLAGLLETMKDPRLVALNSGEVYTYGYDTMGRKINVTYPLDSINPPARRVESFQYDTAGRLWKFINRNGKTQTFTYDALNRMSYFTWNDGLTPRVDFGYDTASRLTSITNSNATISRQYFNDDLLRVETEQIINGPLSQLVYTYDADGNRASAIIWPSNASFNYLYTGRNQLKNIVDNVSGATLATYGYDLAGNLESRTLNNSTSTTYAYDGLDQVTWVTHALNGTTRRFTYGYDSVGNRKWAQRDLGNGDVFGYDLNDQMTAIRLNIPNPDTASVGAPTILYDANGNRTSFAAYGPTQTYATNYLSQYTARTNSTSPLYDPTGNMTRGMDNSAYVYDAQNRLLTANTSQFKYDGLNRQVSRTVGGVTTYSAWDGWDLMQEYQGVQGSTITARYVHGATGLVKNQLTNNYYYQDGSGSTSHLASSSGALLEWYRYDLHGTPIFYDAANVQISGSNQGVRHLFTGQQWYSELGLYDLRNRFYSPDIGRFLQPDPIGFWGDRSNLYRYCRNNPVKWSDPAGLQTISQQYQNSESDYPGVTVRGYWEPPTEDPARGAGPLDWSGGLPGEGSPFDGFGPLENIGRHTFELVAFIDQPSEQSPASEVPPQNPPAISTTIALGPGIGVQFTVTWDLYGQTFISFGGQAGKSWPALPVSIAVTGDYIIGQKNPSASQIARTRRGFGWSASAGYWAGGQLSGPATPQIFLPSLTGAGAGAPNMWGGGFVSPPNWRWSRLYLAVAYASQSPAPI
jgi:RHS repeat-associated protein